MAHERQDTSVGTRPPTTVYEQLRAFVKSGATPEEAADRVIARMLKRDLAKLVRPLLVNEARRDQRSQTRQIEEEVGRRIAEGEDPLSVRRKLSQSSFALPTGEYVDWLDATAEQHLARAGWSRHQAGALVADAERHEAAAAAIEAAGVDCLRDLEEAA